MSTTITARTTTERVADTRSRGATKSLPPPPHLTSTQHRELESDLRRELATLERRLANERVDESVRTPWFTIQDASVTSRGTSDTMARREAVTQALARLSAGTYGVCGRCATPIPFGRLLAMPEVTDCLRCHGL